MGFRLLIALTEEQSNYLEKTASREGKSDNKVFNEIVEAYLKNPTRPPKDLPPRPIRKFFQLEVEMARGLNELCREFDNRTRPDLVYMAINRAMYTKEGG